MLSLVNILVGTLCCAWSAYLITHGRAHRSHWVLGLLGIGFVAYGTYLAL